MSFLFGGREGYRDAEVQAGNRRFREHIARDINDERTLAAGGEVAGHKRRTGWLLLVAVAAFFLLLALVRGGGSGELPIARDCATAAVVLGADRVQAGELFELRSTGPQEASYIVTIDGTPVQGQPDRQVALRQTPDGPAFGLIDCVSPSFLVPSPTQPGPHEIGLLQVDAAGTREVAALTLTITG